MEPKCRLITESISSINPLEFEAFKTYAVGLSCITCGDKETLNISEQISMPLATESAKFIMETYLCPLKNNPVE